MKNSEEKYKKFQFLFTLKKSRYQITITLMVQHIKRVSFNTLRKYRGVEKEITFKTYSRLKQLKR